MNRAENVFQFRRVNFHGDKGDPNYAEKYHPGPQGATEQGATDWSKEPIHLRQTMYMEGYSDETVFLRHAVEAGNGTGRDQYGKFIQDRVDPRTGVVTRLYPYYWHQSQQVLLNNKPMDTIWNSEIKERWPELFEGLSDDEADTLLIVMSNLGQPGNNQDSFINNVLAGFSDDERASFYEHIAPRITLGSGGSELIEGIYVDQIFRPTKDAWMLGVAGGDLPGLDVLDPNLDNPASALHAMRVGLDLADQYHLPVYIGAYAFDPFDNDNITIGDGLPTTDELVSLYTALGFEGVDTNWVIGEDMVYWPGNTGPLRRADDE
jgi:hypothetical protein